MTTPKVQHADDYNHLGCALAQLRQASGLTQLQAGDRIGIRANFVSEVERGNRGMRWHSLLKMLDVYGSDLHDLAAALDEVESAKEANVIGEPQSLL
jgi:transcriptional regulator with XRE-family HTH domain